MTLKVFITGASTGIGEALAVYYAGKGATLGLAARRAEFLDALNRRLGGTHATFALDVRDAPALHAAAADFIARFGAPDIVIANAGISAGTLTEHEEDLEAFRQIMDTNVFGMAATFAPFIPALRAAPGESGKMRRLVGIASVAGIRGLPGAEAYSASKAAAITYLESLRLEMRPYGIKVVTIAPGYIETPMTAVNRYKMPFLLAAAPKNGNGVLSDVDVRVKADLEKLVGWSGTTAYLNILDDRGDAFNALYAGTLMGVSNIEVAVPSTRVFQAWIQQNFFDDQFSLLAGLYPIDSEFFVMESAALLIHPTFGTPGDLAMTHVPAVFNNSALGLRAKWLAGDRTLYGMAAVLDGVAGDPANPQRNSVKLGKRTWPPHALPRPLRAAQPTR